MPTYIGLHTGHNASVSLVQDGSVSWCLQEERFRREKNYSGFPSEALNWLLTNESTSEDDIDQIVFGDRSVKYNTDRLQRVEEYKKQRDLLYRTRKRTQVVRNRVLDSLRLYDRLKLWKARSQRLEPLEEFFSAEFLEENVTFVDHHHSHAATAYYGSPWDEALVLTLDGGGDRLCATVSIGRDDQLERIAETPVGHSVANIYARVTHYLGFIPLEHEYKLMGMAPYSSGAPVDEIYDVFDDYLSVSGLDFSRNTSLATYLILPRLEQDLSLTRFDWVCAALQRFAEETVIEWVRNAVEETGIRKIALAGGFFMNVKANKRIAEQSFVDDVFVFPSCGDESISVGGPMVQHVRDVGTAPNSIDHIYWGSDIERDGVEAALAESDFDYEYQDDIERKVGHLLAEGKIVARCAGRMEFGARALGNRSILANPSNPFTVRTINSMIKERDFWMPFAPSILAERSDDYLSAPSPEVTDGRYMIMAYDTTDKYEDLIAAVHPEDLTARPQLVTRESNPDYYRLLKSFENGTGIGAVLNTSFNIHGEPIVRSPENALSTFRRSGLRYLALGDYLVRKSDVTDPRATHKAVQSG